MCLVLGVLHPDHLHQKLTARQWDDWVKWASVEPIGDEREDYRAAHAAAGIAACLAEGVKTEQFMIDWLHARSRPLTLDEKIKFIVGAHNARVKASGHR